jgi:hypothetical protein
MPHLDVVRNVPGANLFAAFGVQTEAQVELLLIGC